MKELEDLNDKFMSCLPTNKDFLALDLENFCKFFYAVFPGNQISLGGLRDTNKKNPFKLEGCRFNKSI